MKLTDKILDRKIAYWFRRDPAIAFELALLSFVLARRREAQGKIAEACRAALFWLNKAGVVIPPYVPQLSCYAQREEIEKLLVINKGLQTSLLADYGLAKFKKSS